MLLRLRTALTIFLIAALPFNALLVTVLTRVIAGAGHAPLPFLALWKEVLLGVILLLALPEILRRRASWRVDVIDILIILLLLLSVLVTLATHRDIGLYAVGFKYDFVPLLAFVMLRRAAWPDDFIVRLRPVFLILGAVIAGYGLASFLLPTSFFTWLGYSDLHSLYVPDGPIAAYQQLGGLMIRRIQSVMSGPNQLGLWLLLPWSIALLSIRRLVRGGEIRRMLIVSGILILLGGAMLLTFSRSAWIAAAVIGLAVLCMDDDRGGAVLRMTQRRLMAAFLALAMLCAGAILFAPDIVVRSASTSDHYRRAVEAVRTMTASPFGRGIGAAGPASNRVSDACVFLEGGADASWARDREDLCVFVGTVQMQPEGRKCRCPVLPENWYLQIGVEIGWIGMMLFLALVVLILFRLPKHLFPFHVFLGVSTAAFFLHAWEGAPLAYTVWVLMAALLPVRGRDADAQKIA